MSPLIILILIVAVRSGMGLDMELRVMVEPQKQSCFYETLSAGSVLELDYQVLDGGHGSLDISFYITDPEGKIILADFKQSIKTHDVTIETTGDYKFCFDNSFSMFNSKTVFFEIVVDDKTDEQWDNSYGNEEVVDQGIVEMKKSLTHIRSLLTQADSIIDSIKLTEVKDRNIAEEACYRMNKFSCIILVVIVTCSIVQIVMVKSIFEEKSKLGKIWSFFRDK